MSDDLKADILRAAERVEQQTKPSEGNKGKAFGKPLVSQYTYNKGKSFGDPQLLNENGLINFEEENK